MLCEDVSPQEGARFGGRPFCYTDRMASDSDHLEDQLQQKVKVRRELGDLEEQLEQNLKLRRDLGAKIAKARDRNAKDRLGWALYWILLAARWDLGVHLALDAPWGVFQATERWG